MWHKISRLQLSVRTVSPTVVMAIRALPMTVIAATRVPTWHQFMAVIGEVYDAHRDGYLGALHDAYHGGASQASCT